MAIGTKKVEDYIPVIKYNEGFYSTLDFTVATGAVVTLPSTTTIGGSAVVALGDITSSSTTATAFTVTNSGIFTGASVVSFVANSLTTGTQFLVTANGVTSGHMLSLVSTGTIVTTGDVLSIAANTATTSTGIVRVSATGLTDGFAMAITSGGANLTANGGGINLSLGASTLGTGISVVSTGAMITTSSLLTLTANSATTAAGLLRINGNALTDGKGLVIASSSAVMTSTGRLLHVSHTGNAGVSAVLAEVSSAAADETVVFQVSASAALAAGKVVNVSGAAVTTGTLLSVANADALTTGMIAQFKSNSSDATARTLVDIHNDHASAVGTIPLKITQDAPTSTNFKLMMTLGTMQIFVSDQTSPNTALTATEGSICLNGSATGQAFWNTDGATAWTALA